MFRTDPDARKRNARVHFLRVSASVVRATRLFALPVIRQPRPSEVKPDQKLVNLLEDAERAKTLMQRRRELGIPELAAAFGCQMNRFTRLVRLNYLAPDIMLSIRDGVQPAGLTRRSLLKIDLPLDWATQRNLLGFPAQPEHFRNPSSSQPDLEAATEAAVVIATR